MLGPVTLSWHADEARNPKADIAAFCEHRQITESCWFGSVLREDFRPDSDVDVLVTFAPGATWTLLDMVRMEVDLKRLFGREVDLVSRATIEGSENYIRRERILQSPEPIYVAR